MGRLRDIREFNPAPAIAETSSIKVRGDALSESAAQAKRSADALIEQEDARVRMLAGFAGGGGLLSIIFGLAVIGGIGQTHVFAILAGVSILVPTVFAFMQAVGAASRIADASYERGLCHVFAVQAKRLGDAVGATDQRNTPLGPEAIINGQLDALYKDLDRCTQRLKAAGAEGGPSNTANRLHGRIVPHQTDTFLTSSDGRRYPVRIADISQSDVALKGSLPPVHEKEQVQVGARRAQVVRIDAGQVAVQFLTPILPSEFNRRIVL